MVLNYRRQPEYKRRPCIAVKICASSPQSLTSSACSIVPRFAELGMLLHCCWIHRARCARVRRESPSAFAHCISCCSLVLLHAHAFQVACDLVCHLASPIRQLPSKTDPPLPGCDTRQLKAQREVAKGMALCFGCATCLYAWTFYTQQLP